MNVEMRAMPRARRRGWCAVALAGTLLLAGCASLAPPQETPAVALAADWAGTPPDGWISAETRRDWQAGEWWRLFDDPALDALAGQVEMGNQNLALAAANVAQAEALLRQAEAARWPTLGAQLNAQRSGRPARGSAALQLAASWAPDLWGRLADSVRAQEAGVQASTADLAAARLAAQGSLAQAYFGLREADAEIALLDDIIVGYTTAVEMTGNRYRAGIAPHTDLLQAQGTLANAEASRVALARSRTDFEHAIALLVGVPPAQFALASAAWDGGVPRIPGVLPSELLLRRPDIASAGRAVAAANARIGVARGAWFPDFSLSAGLGGSAASLSSLASAPVLAWSLGTALAQAIFDAGARDAAIEQARAAHAAATASYRQTALAAFAEVEDQLTALDTLAAQAEHARAAAQASAGAEARIMNSYKAGLSAFTDVIVAQNSALAARRSVLQLQVQRQQAAVALIQALGGGWQAPWAEAADAPRATPL